MRQKMIVIFKEVSSGRPPQSFSPRYGAVDSDEIVPNTKKIPAFKETIPHFRSGLPHELPQAPRLRSKAFGLQDTRPSLGPQIGAGMNKPN
jgi:hypothetical protein